MTAQDYFAASAASVAIRDAAATCSGSGLICPDDEAAMSGAEDAERDALGGIIETPATSLAEITARAAILSALINKYDGDGVYENFWPALSARIAADLQNLAA